MTRYYRRADECHATTVTVRLPQDCLYIVEQYKKQTGGNRSVALEYIIRDWKRTMDEQRRKKNGKMD